MAERGVITRREWRGVLIFAALLMLITTLPYLIGWLRQGRAWTFGGFLFGVEDGYSYLAKMRLGARGEWLFTLRYTSEPHEGALLFFPYLLLGQITGLVVGRASEDLAFALAVAFHAARVLAGLLLIAVSYRFIAHFLRAPRSRRLALLLATLGGGLGWLLALIGWGHWQGSLPVDFYIPEGYSFLILFGLPHLALARAALLAGFLALFRALSPAQAHPWRWTLLAGLCWLITGLCVPFDLAILYALLGSWGLASWLRDRRFPWRLARRASAAAAITLPLLIYTLRAFTANPAFRQWSAQNQLPSPHPLHYVFGYAALAVPAILALGWAWRRAGRAQSSPLLLLAVWLLAAPLLVYLPVNVQRRLAEGVILPLSILAAAGLRLAFRSRRRYRRARAALLALVLPTAALLWLGATFSALRPDRPIFRPRDEVRALAALNRLAPPDAVILSSKETGNVIPAFTDLRAYVGHGPETLHFAAKDRAVRQFFAGELAPAPRRALLAEVDYVWAGPLEQPAAPGWDAGLRRVESFAPSGPYALYEGVP